MTITKQPVEEPPAPRPGATHCHTCGAELPADSRFCAQCGRALGAVLAPKPSDIVTIVFIDLEGFSRYTSKHSAEAVRELVRVFQWLVREKLAQYKGFEVKHLGDGFMIAFSDAARGVAFTVAAQRSMSDHPVGSVVRLCAGINSGNAIREGDDFFGSTVNLASRIAARATGGQVLVSETTRQLAGEMDGVEFADAGRKQFRGIPGRHRVYEALWRG